MDLKKRLKGFFTLSCKRSDGFTLVELIVVIAILAILGGVAVPAYSGYVEKAERAADEELLASVNTAFASACMINGESNYFRTDVDANIENGALAYAEPFAESFNGFYEGGTFKVFTDVYYNKDLGMFAEGYAITYDGVTIVLSQEDIENLKNSAFAEIGADKLLAMIDKAAGLIDITNASSTLGQLAQSEEAMAFLYEKLGVSSIEEIGGILSNKYPQGNMTDEEYNAYLDEKYNQMVANSAVLFAAQNSQAASDGIWDVLNATSVKDSIKANPNVDQQLAQSAMAFAMYSAYTKTDSMDNVELQDVYNTLDSQEFKQYLTTDQAKKDLDGYLSSMNMVNDGVSSDPAAAQDVLLNGYSNEKLANLMSQLIGN